MKKEARVLNKAFGSDVSFAKAVVAEIVTRVTEFAPHASNDDMGDLRLVLSELIINAMLYGNNGDPRKSVTVDVRFDGLDGAFVFKISDEGRGFDHRAMFAECSAEGFDVLASDHGRGIVLARALTENFAYNDEGNIVSFRKTFAAAGAAGTAGGVL